MPVVAVAAYDEDLGEVLVQFGGHGVSGDFFFGAVVVAAAAFEMSAGRIRANRGLWLAKS